MAIGRCGQMALENREISTAYIFNMRPSIKGVKAILAPRQVALCRSSVYSAEAVEDARRYLASKHS